MIQGLDSKVPIVNPDGTPTLYLLQLLQGRGGNIQGAVNDAAGALTVAQAAQADVDALELRNINTGSGLTGGGNLTADRTLSLNAGINLLTDVDTATTPPTSGQALVWETASSLWKPGTVSGGGGGLSSGTSFPGSPLTNDLFYRTDRALLYFYNGTRWLTVNTYSQQYDLTQYGTANIEWPLPMGNLYDVWSVSLHISGFVGTGAPASNYRTYTMNYYDGVSGAAVGSVNTTGFTASGIWSQASANTGVLVSKTNKILYSTVATTGTPSPTNHRLNHIMRLVG